ncbi:MAG: VOC family protein, partial [Kofleriaceae bacterium]
MTTSMTTANPPPVTGVTPHLQLSDASAAADLYVRAFGAEIVQKMPADDGKRLMHCFVRINNGNLFIADPFPEAGCPLQPLSGVALHLQVADVDAW